MLALFFEKWKNVDKLCLLWTNYDFSLQCLKIGVKVMKINKFPYYDFWRTVRKHQNDKIFFKQTFSDTLNYFFNWFRRHTSAHSALKFVLKLWKSIYFPIMVFDEQSESFKTTKFSPRKSLLIIWNCFDTFLLIWKK